MNSDLLVSIRRTVVPILVGSLLSTFLGGHVDPEALRSVISGAISAVYYTVFRILELKIPELGVLLGARKQPVYVASDKL